MFLLGVLQQVLSINQKILVLGADLALHSATKFIGGHNDVLGGYISGSLKLVSQIRALNHVLGGTLKSQPKCCVSVHSRHKDIGSPCTETKFNCIRDGQNFRGTS